MRKRAWIRCRDAPNWPRIIFLFGRWPIAIVKSFLAFAKNPLHKRFPIIGGYIHINFVHNVSVPGAPAGAANLCCAAGGFLLAVALIGGLGGPCGAAAGGAAGIGGAKGAVIASH